MTTEMWTTVAIIVGTMCGLFIFFLILSSKKIDTLKKKTTPPPTEVIYGPKLAEDRPPDSEWDAIEKSRGTGVTTIPIILKTVVGFYDTVYIGESYSCKIFLFNTAKNAQNAETIIQGLMAKDQDKRFATDTLYAKDQEPVKVKIEIFAPNFTVTPSTRIVEVPAGATATSTHLIAPINSGLNDKILGKRQAILVSFEQILGENENVEEYHLGSLDYHVKIEKAVIPVEIETELKTQEKISYISSAAGAVTAILTIVTTVLAIFGL
ncbi:MAG: hypothetical protein ACTSYB_12895 [Candidatus Helarchaeota archaeon]